MTIDQHDGFCSLTVADFSEAYALELAAHAFPWPESVFRQSISNGHPRYAWRRDGQLVAMAFFQGVKPEIELLNLAVDPICQGKGVGRALLESSLAVLKVAGYQRCFLEVRASNKAAICLYERLGFNQMGVRAGYYPAKGGHEDAHLYVLEWLADEDEIF